MTLTYIYLTRAGAPGGMGTYRAHTLIFYSGSNENVFVRTFF